MSEQNCPDGLFTYSRHLIQKRQNLQLGLGQFVCIVHRLIASRGCTFLVHFHHGFTGHNHIKQCPGILQHHPAVLHGDIVHTFCHTHLAQHEGISAPQCHLQSMIKHNMLMVDGHT